MCELGVVAVLSTHLWDEIFLKNRGRRPAGWSSSSVPLAWFGGPGR
jgi:hypothetical protein